jgi:hypothetical protein
MKKKCQQKQGAFSKRHLQGWMGIQPKIENEWIDWTDEEKRGKRTSCISFYP